MSDSLMPSGLSISISGYPENPANPKNHFGYRKSLKPSGLSISICGYPCNPGNPEKSFQVS